MPQSDFRAGRATRRKPHRCGLTTHLKRPGLAGHTDGVRQGKNDLRGLLEEVIEGQEDLAIVPINDSHATAPPTVRNTHKDAQTAYPDDDARKRATCKYHVSVGCVKGTQCPYLHLDNARIMNGRLASYTPHPAILEPVPALTSLTDSHVTTTFYSVHESGLRESVSVEGELSIMHPETHTVVAGHLVIERALVVDIPVEPIPASPKVVYVPVVLPPTACAPEPRPPTTSTMARTAVRNAVAMFEPASAPRTTTTIDATPDDARKALRMRAQVEARVARYRLAHGLPDEPGGMDREPYLAFRETADMYDVGPLWSTQEPPEVPKPVIMPPPPLGGVPPAPPGGIAMPLPPLDADHLRPFITPTVVDAVVLLPPSSLPNRNGTASASSSSGINRGQAPDENVSRATSIRTPQRTTQALTETETTGLPPVAMTVAETTPPIADALHSQIHTSGEQAGNVNVSPASAIARDYEALNPEIAGAQAETLKRKSKIIVN
jgi:hypothetical protein